MLLASPIAKPTPLTRPINKGHPSRRYVFYFLPIETYAGLHCLSVELTFWLFMLNQGPGKSKWFSSYEYRVWFFGMLLSPSSFYLLLTAMNYSGSITSVLGLPLTVLVAKSDIALVIASIYTLVEQS